MKAGGARCVARWALPLALLSGRVVMAHSWVEAVLRIADGKFVGPAGYPRDFIPRDENFSDVLAQNKVVMGKGEAVPDSARMCRPGQTMDAYTSEFPPVRVQGGDWVALGYRENGHATLKLEFKPQNGGTVFIYGTDHPAEDEQLNNVHMVWNADGTGGDGRGRLLATRNFDNGRCHEINGGAESRRRSAETGVEDLMCQADVQIPPDAAPGSNYTLYWVWDWPSLPALIAAHSTGTEPLEGRDSTEIYTSCVDVAIVLPDEKAPAEPNPCQPPDSAANDADPEQLIRPFQVIKYIGALVGETGYPSVFDPPVMDPPILLPPPPPPRDHVGETDTPTTVVTQLVSVTVFQEVVTTSWQHETVAETQTVHETVAETQTVHLTVLETQTVELTLLELQTGTTTETVTETKTEAPTATTEPVAPDPSSTAEEAEVPEVPTEDFKSGSDTTILIVTATATATATTTSTATSTTTSTASSTTTYTLLPAPVIRVENDGSDEYHIGAGDSTTHFPFPPIFTGEEPQPTRSSEDVVSTPATTFGNDGTSTVVTTASVTATAVTTAVSTAVLTSHAITLLTSTEAKACCATETSKVTLDMASVTASPASPTSSSPPSPENAGADADDAAEATESREPAPSSTSDPVPYPNSTRGAIARRLVGARYNVLRRGRPYKMPWA